MGTDPAGRVPRREREGAGNVDQRDERSLKFVSTMKKVIILTQVLSRGGEIMGPIPFFKTKVKRTERRRRS